MKTGNYALGVGDTKGSVSGDRPARAPQNEAREVISDPPTVPSISDTQLEAGEVAVLEEIGGADCGGHFSARDLARKVYVAMERARQLPDPRSTHNRGAQGRRRGTT
jgi:hypothetical protein